MWDEDDTTARSVHLICGVIFLAVAAGCGYISLVWYPTGSGYYGGYRSRGGAAGALRLGAIYLGIRCLWYAFTGKDNINRDDF